MPKSPTSWVDDKRKGTKSFGQAAPQIPSSPHRRTTSEKAPSHSDRQTPKRTGHRFVLHPWVVEADVNRELLAIDPDTVLALGLGDDVERDLRGLWSMQQKTCVYLGLQCLIAAHQGLSGLARHAWTTCWEGRNFCCRICGERRGRPCAAQHLPNPICASDPDRLMPRPAVGPPRP
jgi:hypothetical protein